MHFGLDKDFLFKSTLGHCDEERFRDLLYCVNVPKKPNKKKYYLMDKNFLIIFFVL